jgi:hypothetical protein
MRTMGRGSRDKMTLTGSLQHREDDMGKKKRSTFGGKKSLRSNGRISDKANRRGRTNVMNFGPQNYYSQAPSVDDPKLAGVLIRHRSK